MLDGSLSWFISPSCLRPGVWTTFQIHSHLACIPYYTPTAPVKCTSHEEWPSKFGYTFQIGKIFQTGLRVARRRNIGLSSLVEVQTVGWCKKQNCVAQSFTEAMYVALIRATLKCQKHVSRIGLDTKLEDYSGRACQPHSIFIRLD